MNSAEDIPSEILNALLSSMFEISPIAMSISSSNGRDSRYLRVNDAYLKLIGRDWSELQGVRVAETAVKEDEARARRHKRLATEGGYVGEYVEILRSDGKKVPTLISAQRSIINGVQYDVEIIVDISIRIDEQRAHEQQLAELARTDAVSGLANRRAFDERMQAWVQEGVSGLRKTLALLDLDGFKAINDSHGHDVGDAVLQTVSQRVAQSLREGDFVARIGGDEFAILFKPTPHAIPANRFEHIAQAINAPMDIQGHKLSVGVSIGAAELEPNDDLLSFFRRADERMYGVKQSRSSASGRVTAG